MIRLTPYSLSIRNKVNGNELRLDGRDGLVVAPLHGMTAIPIDLNLAQGVGRVGSTVQGHSVQGYSIMIKGTILGYVEDRKKRLFDVLVPETECELIYRESKETWIIDVLPKVNPDIQHVTSFARFGFTVFAPHPYWRNTQGSRRVLSGSEAMFRFMVNYGEPHIFGERLKGKSVNANNYGNVPIRFVLMFVAHVPDVLNPKVINVETREFIQINRKMEVGEVIIVDMTISPMTVTSVIGNTETDIFEDFELDSVPFSLKVGDNFLQDDAENNHGGMDCWILYHDEYSGVW
jgi:hypothetical protein